MPTTNDYDKFEEEQNINTHLKSLRLKRLVFYIIGLIIVVALCVALFHIR